MALNVSVTFPDSASASAVADLKVRRYELSDAMGELFELTIELLSSDIALAEADVVGQPVVVDFSDEPILKQLRGIVWQMKQATAVSGGDSRYILTIVPPLRLTTQRHDHRIFQDKSVPQMVDEVLSGYDGRIDVPAKYGTDDAETWEYTVQYRETDWQFLLRILGDGGFATFFDHAAGSYWTLVDDTTTDLPSDGPTIPFLDQTMLKAPDEGTPYILTMASQRTVRTSRVSLRDYNYENPAAKAEGTDAIEPDNAVESEPDLEHYEFNVDYFTDEDSGNSYAKLRLQGLRTGVRLVLCTTNFTTSPGSRLTVEGHPNLDGEYLVVRVHAVVDDGGERKHELVLMDAEQPFVPPVQKQPRIHGIQTAVVVGAEGKEIDVDQLGRVLLAFRWDRRDPKSGAPTRRVRVSQGWSGTDRGFITLPRIGDEVLVAYLDGDPANPIVVGRVHNGASTSPLSLPADAAVSVWRSKSTPGGNGFNEIRMDDKAGAERLTMHAQRDFKQVVENDAETVVGRNEKRTVKGNRTLRVVGNQVESVEGDKWITATGALNLHGNTVAMSSDDTMKLWSGGYLNITCRSDRDDYTSCNHAIEADALFIKGRSGVQVVAPKIHLFGGEEIHLQVGGSSIHITAGGIKITSSGNVDVSGALVRLNC
jgi:type VI secretion system secreted protein VgrG